MSYTARGRCLFVIIPYSFTRFPYLGWETQYYPNPVKEKRKKRQIRKCKRECKERNDAALVLLWIVLKQIACNVVWNHSYECIPTSIMIINNIIVCMLILYRNTTLSLTRKMKMAVVASLRVRVCVLFGFVVFVGLWMSMLRMTSLLVWWHRRSVRAKRKGTNGILKSRWFEVVLLGIVMRWILVGSIAGINLIVGIVWWTYRRWIHWMPDGIRRLVGYYSVVSLLLLVVLAYRRGVQIVWGRQVIVNKLQLLDLVVLWGNHNEMVFGKVVGWVFGEACFWWWYGVPMADFVGRCLRFEDCVYR